MGYKRAEWSSGLTYEQTCNKCNTMVKYKDNKLEFRPWYADGFIYCPTCKNPLRHEERFAIDSLKPSVVDLSGDAPSKQKAKFCHNCGTPFAEESKFCARCGAKRL